jgi:hypothetical protein
VKFHNLFVQDEFTVHMILFTPLNKDVVKFILNEEVVKFHITQYSNKCESLKLLFGEVEYIVATHTRSER